MVSNTPLFDFIIVTYNSTDHLRRCLTSINDHNDWTQFKIHIVDNGEDADLSLMLESFPTVRKVPNQKNIGFAKAVNRAMDMSTAPYICVLNPDTIISDRFLEKCLGYFKYHPSVSTLGPKIYNEDGTIQGSARSFPTLLTSLFGRTSWLTKAYPRNAISKKNIVNIDSLCTSPVEVDWVSGACMVIRREAVNNVGNLDERFFMYWEDADWCRRMHEKGWKVIYFPEASLLHICGQSSKTRPIKSIYHFHKSCYRLYEKYTSSYQTLLLPIILLGLSIRMLLLLLNAIIKQKLCRNL